MNRNLLLLTLVLFATSCSFKKDGVDTPPKVDNGNASTTREAVEASAVSNFDKLAYAIDKNDSALFDSILKVAKRSDLNQLSSYGKSLLEMTLQKKRMEFFKLLLAAGASPFRPTASAPEGLRTTYVADRDSRMALLDATRAFSVAASRVCLLNDLKKTIEHLDENFILPTYFSCGDLSIFDYYLNDQVSGLRVKTEQKLELIKHFLDSSRAEYRTNVGALLKIGFKTNNGELLRLVSNECRQLECKDIPLDFLYTDFTVMKLDEALRKYEFFITSIFRSTIYVNVHPLPDPPPPGGGELVRRAPVEMDILDKIKYEMKRKIYYLSESDPEKVLDIYRDKLIEFGLIEEVVHE